MAGELLIKMLKERGGKDSEYSDVVYGVVNSIKPLKVQLANNIVIDDNFIVLGKHIGKFKLPGKAKIEVKSHSDQIGNVSGNRPTVSEDITFKEMEFDNRLKKGDKVTMIRMDGGQQFYLFEREEA
ncbi:DUF2577 family protein [Lactobacillus sp. ESL0225]|uniref:DUF2577 family protein n=1 Tax=Lactobacillus sp. ESL0225 TaxID=2069351 RepID=UPI000EFC146A|nr:DUF2577 family protein [Lactobacillus sp. ESL0225]RMC50824.1 DUF2577 domain-containing protein [Lactobacillus sp. ESL0225]